MRKFIKRKIQVAPTDGKVKVFPDLVTKKFYEYDLGTTVHIIEDLNPTKEELKALESFLRDQDTTTIFVPVYVYALHSEASQYKITPNPGATSQRIS